MGQERSIAKTNDFWVKNLQEFKEGLKGYRGIESDVTYFYSDYKRRSKKALINMSSDDFSEILRHKDDKEDVLDLFVYIQKNLAEGEKCVIHLVEYEHGRDMIINKYIINEKEIVHTAILE